MLQTQTKPFPGFYHKNLVALLFPRKGSLFGGVWYKRAVRGLGHEGVVSLVKTPPLSPLLFPAFPTRSTKGLAPPHSTLLFPFPLSGFKGRQAELDAVTGVPALLGFYYPAPPPGQVLSLSFVCSHEMFVYFSFEYYLSVAHVLRACAETL